jgi:high-affinity Fe2+/Pb2+ permease
MTALAAIYSAAALEAGRYLHWGVISISLTNFSIIIGMLVVFVLALVVPFGRRQQTSARPGDQAGDHSGDLPNDPPGGSHRGGAS